MKTLFKLLLATIVFLVLTVVAILGTFMVRPQFFLNDHSLPLIAKVLSRSGINLKWKHGHLRAQSQSFWRKEISLSLEAVNFEMKTIKSSAAHLQISAEVDLQHLPPRLTSIGPIALTKSAFSLQSVPSPATPKQPENTTKSESPSSINFNAPDQFIPEWLKAANFKGLAIELDRYEIKTEGRSISGAANLSGQPRAEGSAWQLVHTTILTQSDQHFIELQGDLDLKSLGSLWSGPYKITLNEKGKIEKMPASIQLQANQKNLDEINYDFNANLALNKKKKITATINGSYRKDSLQGTINASLTHLIDEIPALNLNRCAFKLAPSAKNAKLHQLDLNCPLAIDPSLPKLEKQLPVNILGETKLVFTSQLLSQFPPSGTSPIVGDVDIEVDSLSSAILTGRGGIKIKVDGNLSALPNSLNAKSQIDMALEMPHFEQLTKQLGNKSSWGIPEPFNGMSGPISLKITGDGDLPWKMRLFPMEFSTKLATVNQRFFVDAKGSLSFEQKAAEHSKPASTEFSCTSEVTLSDIRLVLPRLDLGLPPRLIPDSRIKIGGVEKAKESNGNFAFHYNLKVHTPVDHPILINSNLAKRDIPLALNLSLSDSSPMHLSVRVAQFPVNLFRRDALLDHFNLYTNKDGKRLLIDGKVSVVYTDYTIIINLSGSADSPDILLDSHPQLSQNDMYAVLVFGKKIDQLEPGQSESVGNAQAALAANSAVSLASMFLLASTPIESIGYDPNSQVMTAKVRLSDGTSLNIGSDFRDISSLGIRHRLGPDWAITTYLDNPFDNNRVLNALLEWSRKY